MNTVFLKNIFLRSFILSLLALASNFNLLCSNRSIDIENDCNYPMHIVTSAPDLKIDHLVPTNSHSKITVQVTQIPNLQKLLFNAIKSNSAKKITRAVRAGAAVNLEINGKKPLEWAFLLGKIESIKCLVHYNAAL